MWMLPYIEKCKQDSLTAVLTKALKKKGLYLTWSGTLCSRTSVLADPGLAIDILVLCSLIYHSMAVSE